MKRKGNNRVNNVVLVADTHSGCATALIHPDGVKLDDGGMYRPSHVQHKMWDWWMEFWEWVREKTHDEPIDTVHLGDPLQGKPHDVIHNISDNIDVQMRIAHDVLAVPRAMSRKMYFVRGTEAHGGKSLQHEEALARELDAEPDQEGRFTRYVLWKLMGRTPEGFLLNCMHHIGTTGSSHYEATAVLKELTEAYNEAGRWRERAPDCVARAHRHRHIKVEVPVCEPWCLGIALTVPGWQGMTPYAAKIPGARQTTPQFGGVLIREAPDGAWYATAWTRSIKRGRPEE